MVRPVVSLSLSFTFLIGHIFSFLPHNCSAFVLKKKLLLTVSVNSKLLSVLTFNFKISLVAITCNSNVSVV